MAIPASIQAKIAAMNAAFLAATPIASAPKVAIKALQANAADLITSIDAALPASAGALDTFSPSSDPAIIATGVLGLLSAAQNQRDLADLRGIAGRIASNIDQA